MRKNIIIICCIILLTSCSVDWNGTKDQRITELEKQITELKNTTSTGMIVFEKHIRCAAIAPDLQTKIDSFNKEYATLGKFSIGGVFYSPIKDACFWIRLTTTNAPDGSPMERRGLYQFGDDFGATEPVIGCEKILGETKGTNTCADWDNELKKFKWEDTENVLNP